MALNTQQLEAARFFASSKDTIVVQARAGSGKTSWILALSEMPKSKTALYLAFTNAAKDELIKRKPSLEGRVKTIYQIGLAACRGLIQSKLDINGYKYSDILKDLINSDEFESLCKSMGVSSKTYTNPQIFNEVLSLVNLSLVNLLWDETLVNEFVSKNFVISPVLETWSVSQSIKLGLQSARKGLIDFSDMVAYPFSPGVDCRGYFPSYSTVFLDEAQDCSAAQIRIVKEVCHGQLVAIGDPKQCQPTGTKVLVDKSTGRHQKKDLVYHNIEDLKEGMNVVSPVLKDGHYYKSVIEKIASRHYQGTLILAEVGDNVSRYTPDHLVLVNFKPLSGLHYVYMMKQGNYYRIGKTVVHTKASPYRWNAEKADAVWILGFFENDSDARDFELKMAWAYGIPTLMFEERNNVRYDGVLEKFWSGLPDLTDRATKCLRDCDLDIRYPLLVPGNRSNGKQVGLRRPFYTYASNLVTGVNMLPFTGENKFTSKDWSPATISYEDYNGLVYSLDVRHGTYVADGIATHNCIFQFAGSTEDSIGTISKLFNAKEFTFPVCYRCGDEILETVKKIVPDIVGTNKASEVYELESMEDLISELKTDEDWLIIGRVNAILLKAAVELLRLNIPFKFNRSNMESQIKGKASYYKSKDPDFSNIFTQIEIDQKISEFYKNYKSLDLIDCVKILLESYPSLDSYQKLNNKIREIFYTRSSNIVLGTAHSMKGSEADNACIFGSSLFPHPRATKEAELAAEDNLYYVACTRAKSRLVFIDNPFEQST
jgi:hypothetical protein